MREEQSIIKFNQKIPLSFSVIKFDSLFSHMHSNPQIVIVLDGEIEVQINEERFIAKENDIFLINQRVFHSMQAKENALVLSVLIDQYGFGLDQQEADNLYFNLNSIKTPDNTRIESIKYLLYSIVKFNTMENINSIYTNRAITYSLFAQLMNDFKLDITESNQKIASYDTITKITAYVHDNYKNKLSLQYLAEHFNYSIAYLSRLFKQSLNENFIEYYDSLRINYSLDDLISSNKSIEEISTEHGFENSRSYVRAFTKIFNDYPSEYRKKYKSPTQTTENSSKILRKESLNNILKKYDTYASRNDQKETVRDVENIVNINYNDKTINLYSPHLKLLELRSAKYLFYEETRQVLKLIQDDIHFENIILYQLFNKDLRLFIKTDNGIHLNSFVLDNMISFLDSINVNPYFRLEYDFEEMNLSHFEHAVYEFIDYIVENYAPSKIEKFMFSITSTTELSKLKNQEFHDFKSTYTRILSYLRKKNKKFKIGSPTYTKKEILSTNIYKDLFEHLRKHDFEFDFYPISFLDNNEKYIQKNKNELKEFIQYLKDNNLFIERKMYFENINFTNERNLLNDTLYSSNYLSKNLIDNIKSLGAYCKNCFIEHNKKAILSKDPFSGAPGLLTYNNIKKASYNAYVLFSKLGDKLLKKSNNYIVTLKDGNIVILINNYNHYADLYADDQYYDISENDRYVPFPKSTNINFKFSFDNLPKKTAKIKTSYISKTSGSAYDKSINIGNINDLTHEEVNSLKRLSEIDFKVTKKEIHDQSLDLNITIAPLETILIEITFN